MFGDAHDLAAILRWVKDRFWDDKADPEEEDSPLQWPFPQVVRLEVAEALVDLCNCFNGVELAHRKENALPGSKGVVKVRPLSSRIIGTD